MSAGSLGLCSLGTVSLGAEAQFLDEGLLEPDVHLVCVSFAVHPYSVNFLSQGKMPRSNAEACSISPWH